TGKESEAHQAELTFAMARHAAVDLALVFRTPPRTPDAERLSGAQWADIRGQLTQAGFALREGTHTESKLTELRELYEPFVVALADYFVFALPAVCPKLPAVD